LSIDGACISSTLNIHEARAAAAAAVFTSFYEVDKSENFRPELE